MKIALKKPMIGTVTVMTLLASTVLTGASAQA